MNESFSQFKDALATAQTVLISLPQSVNYDKVAAALSLYLSLKKANKQVAIVCPRQITVEFSSLVGADQVAQKIDGKNLTITFDYLEGSVETVSYNIEGNKFNLIIQPKDGFNPPSTEKIDYSYTGAKMDLIVVVGANSLSELGEVYVKNKSLFDEGNVISLVVGSIEHQFGKINLFCEDWSTYSEVIATMIHELQMSIDEDIATNLLKGIERASGGFSLNKSKALTFEAVAFCLKSGAKVVRPPKSQQKEPESNGDKTRKENPSPDWLAPKIYRGNVRT